MKTVVLGLFDRLEDAEQVLAQLAHSPLDLDAVQVLNADMELQRRLSEDAGLPSRRSLRTGLVTGAIAGAGLGFLAGREGPDGAEALLAGLGPLLAMSGGSILGAIAGAIAGALTESNRLPAAHSALALAGLSEGATMVTVRTENEPTARAIGDLFRAGGSRTLETLDPPPATGDRDRIFRPSGDPETMDSASAPASADALPEAHAAFAPPWRREAGEAAPAATVGGMLFPQAESEAAAESVEAGAGAATEESDSRLDPVSPPPPDGIRHGETVISVDRSTREVEPREAPPIPVRSEVESSETAPTEPVSEEAEDADSKSKAVQKSTKAAAKKKPKKVPTAAPASPPAPRPARLPRTGPDAADHQRLESVARDLMQEIFGGSGGSRKA